MTDTHSPRAVPERRVAAVRRFNRFYTRLIGALDAGHLESPFSLPEVRVMYEIAHRERPTATELARELALDAGYLSRMLRALEERGLLRRDPSERDARRSHLALTRKGRGAFARLDARASDAIGVLLAPLSDGEQRRLVEAMEAVERLLGDGEPRAAPIRLREHRPGDMGWVVHRHGVLYWREYGWDERFEALVARVVADFIEHFDPERERCWIAEREGEIVGSVFLVRHPEEEGAAKLRLLLVEPSARGLGLGRRLVSECTRFARRAGYRKISLWTNGVLTAARAIYAREGYRLVRSETHNHFGPDLVAETWELEL
ncbi:MAG TPA: bifunctional helix-turn-helix transcriptional regulator/GNAT family N-acetyltransferase [Gemmatimonadaceae bacterium]|nr:bifunctional helix-turn-helix transcriptional regulator/GNAT family N-acetyltransferase [Gemmatimonadaceae bacterium]